GSAFGSPGPNEAVCASKDFGGFAANGRPDSIRLFLYVSFLPKLSTASAGLKFTSSSPLNQNSAPVASLRPAIFFPSGTISGRLFPCLRGMCRAVREEVVDVGAHIVERALRRLGHA